jgi:hypothetical protein
MQSNISSMIKTRTGVEAEYNVQGKEEQIIMKLQSRELQGK